MDLEFNQAKEKPELIYFAAYGRMECVRMLFKHAEVEYKETQVEKEDYSADFSQTRSLLRSYGT